MIERRVKTSGIKNAITRVVSSHLVYLSFPFAPDLSSSLFVEEKKKGEVVIRGVYHGDRGLAEGAKVVLVGERERDGGLVSRRESPCNYAVANIGKRDRDNVCQIGLRLLSYPREYNAVS